MYCLAVVVEEAVVTEAFADDGVGVGVNVSVF